MSGGDGGSDRAMIRQTHTYLKRIEPCASHGRKLSHSCRTGATPYRCAIERMELATVSSVQTVYFTDEDVMNVRYNDCVNTVTFDAPSHEKCHMFVEFSSVYHAPSRRSPITHFTLSVYLRYLLLTQQPKVFESSDLVAMFCAAWIDRGRSVRVRSTGWCQFSNFRFNVLGAGNCSGDMSRGNVLLFTHISWSNFRVVTVNSAICSTISSVLWIFKQNLAHLFTYNTVISVQNFV